MGGSDLPRCYWKDMLRNKDDLTTAQIVGIGGAGTVGGCCACLAGCGSNNSGGDCEGCSCQGCDKCEVSCQGCDKCLSCNDCGGHGCGNCCGDGCGAPSCGDCGCDCDPCDSCWTFLEGLFCCLEATDGPGAEDVVQMAEVTVIN